MHKKNIAGKIGGFFKSLYEYEHKQSIALKTENDLRQAKALLEQNNKPLKVLLPQGITAEVNRIFIGNICTGHLYVDARFRHYIRVDILKIPVWIIGPFRKMLKEQNGSLYFTHDEKNQYSVISKNDLFRGAPNIPSSIEDEEANYFTIEYPYQYN